MSEGYVHVEIVAAQSSKKAGAPCGDLFACDRTPATTNLVCADGIGSGVRARIAAQLCASRLLELLKLDFSLRRAFASVADTMQRNRDPQRPFAAFSVARVLNDGMATVLSYEAPPPILISRGHASSLPARPLELPGALAAESSCWLEPGDGLLLTSDGITQAGMGRAMPYGWQTEGVVRFVNHSLTGGAALSEIAACVHREALRLSPRAGDDATAVLAHCRRGQIVNLFTGTPAQKGSDYEVVRRFLQSDGIKVVCGGTTAALVARMLGRPVDVEQEAASLVAPPRYEIEGIDLVTEGAVTLNQVYNLLDEPLDRLIEDSGVTELCVLLQVADRVNIVLGGARNRAAGDIAFRQQGILDREQIVPLLAARLRAAGKLVVLERV